MTKAVFRTLWLALLPPLAVTGVILYLASHMRDDCVHYQATAFDDLDTWWRKFKIGGL